MSRIVLPPISTIPFFNAAPPLIIPLNRVVAKDDIKNAIIGHMNVDYCNLLDYCYGTCAYDTTTFYELTIGAIDLITVNHGLWPELPVGSFQRHCKITETFGIPTIEQTSYVGTVIASVHNHCKQFVVSRAKALPGVFSFKITNGTLNHNELFPPIHIDGLPNCTMFLINQEFKEHTDYRETMGNATYDKLCGVYDQIKIVLTDAALDIAECLLCISGYLK